MQQKKEKLAILIDEYGGVSGMVTLEDLIEVIVGDIHEEYEEVEPEIIELEPGHVYSLSGSIALSDLKRNSTWIWTAYVIPCPVISWKFWDISY